MTIFKFIRDKRVRRIKGMWEREKQKSELFEKEYLEERNKRIALESVALTDMEKEYIENLITFDQVINSHKHGTGGLYSDFDTERNDFTYELLAKISKMQVAVQPKSDTK